MTKQVWKFSVPVQDGNFIYQLPKGAQFLSAQNQGSELQSWWLVDLAEPALELRAFRIFGTGHPVPSEYVYLATVQQDRFVWHLFEGNHPE